MKQALASLCIRAAPYQLLYNYSIFTCRTFVIKNENISTNNIERQRGEGKKKSKTWTQTDIPFFLFAVFFSSSSDSLSITLLVDSLPLFFYFVWCTFNNAHSACLSCNGWWCGVITHQRVHYFGQWTITMLTARSLWKLLIFLFIKKATTMLLECCQHICV